MKNKKQDSEFLYSVIAVIFSVDQAPLDGSEIDEDVVEVIDQYFEGLKWEDTSGQVMLEEVNVGTLVEAVDLNKRWMYRGSLTTPPCTQFVLFNVLSTVYPVKQKFVDQFVTQQLSRSKAQRSSDPETDKEFPVA